MNFPGIQKYLVSKFEGCVDNLLFSRLFMSCLPLQKSPITSGNAASGIQAPDLTPHFGLYPQVPQSQRSGANIQPLRRDSNVVAQAYIVDNTLF